MKINMSALPSIEYPSIILEKILFSYNYYFKKTVSWTHHQRFNNRDKFVKVEVDSIYKSRISSPQLHVFIL